MEYLQFWHQELLDQDDAVGAILNSSESQHELKRDGLSKVSEVELNVLPEVSLIEFEKALEESDLEMFTDAWCRSNRAARRLFAGINGDQRMREAFGISYLQVFLAQ